MRKIVLLTLSMIMVLAPKAMPSARADQLLTNADFQTDANADKVPDGWCYGGVESGLPPNVDAFVDTAEVDYDVTLLNGRKSAQMQQIVPVDQINALDVLAFSVTARIPPGDPTGPTLQLKVEYWTAPPACGSGDHTDLVHQIMGTEVTLTTTRTTYTVFTQVPGGAFLQQSNARVTPAITFGNPGEFAAAEIEVSNAVLEHRNDLQNPRKNLLSLKQSTFDAANGTGGTGWNAFGSGVTLVQEGIDPLGPKAEGVRSLEITVTASGGMQGIQMSPKIPISGSTFYALSCWYRGEVLNDPLRFAVQWQDSNNVVLGNMHVDVDVDSQHVLAWGNAPVVVSGQSPPTAAKAVPILTDRGGTAIKWNIDKCQLEQNTVNTTWVPGTTGDIG